MIRNMCAILSNYLLASGKQTTPFFQMTSTRPPHVNAPMIKAKMIKYYHLQFNCITYI